MPVTHCSKIPRCPKNHSEIVLRFVVDAPPILDQGWLEPCTDRNLWNPNSDSPRGTMIGTNAGVWCEACEAWYTEEEIKLA